MDGYFNSDAPSKATEVNANKATSIPYTTQGLDGNACCDRSKENPKT
jgi:hypothetical protein